MTPASTDTLQKHLALFCFVLLGIYTLPTPAHAGNVSDVLCIVYGWLSGALGQVIGALAVVCIALMAMFGRIQLPTVLITIAGLTLIFGASGIVAALGLDPGCTGGVAGPDITSSKIFIMFKCLHSWIAGPVGKSLATLAVITMGVFALYGKISYQQALIISCGIAGMFGGISVIQNLNIAPNMSYSMNANTVCGGAANPMALAYCSMVNWFNGAFGKALATLAIIIVGIGALYGKVSWGMAILAGIGTGLIFGGTTIVGALGGPASADCAALALGGDRMYITVALCNVINWFNGPIGKGVTTLAVIILGLGALFGKVSWTMALVGITGVALVFGATSVVGGLGGIGDAPCAMGNMSNPTGVAGGGGNGGSSSSSSSSGTNPVSGYPAGGTIIYTGGTLVFPNGSTPGSITFEGETVQIPANVVAMDTVTLSNGWILRVPGTGIDGSITIPGKPPLVDRVIPIPGYKAPASNGTNPLTPGFPAAPNTPTTASPSLPGGTVPTGPVTSNPGTSTTNGTNGNTGASTTPNSNSGTNSGTTTPSGGNNSYGLPTGQSYAPQNSPQGTSIVLPVPGKAGFASIPGYGNISIPENYPPGNVFTPYPLQPNGPKIKLPDPEETDPAYQGGWVEFDGTRYPYP